MEKLDILRAVKFGESVAEQEMEGLQEYFVRTHQWQRVFDGEVDVVYGPKGSGKSAIYSLISTCARHFSERGVTLKFAENPRGATAFQDLQSGPPGSEREFVNLWKLYILALVSEVFLESGAVTPEGKTVLAAMQDSGLVERGDSLKALLGKVRNYIRKYFNPASMEPVLEFSDHTGLVKGLGLKVTFMEPTPEMLKRGVLSVDALLAHAEAELRAAGHRIWLLLDRLDVAFSDSPDLEEDALRALFKAYLDLAACEHIKLKIFLRTDIWKNITRKGFREATHITRQSTIDWDRQSVLNLIIRRFLSNEGVRAYYRVDKDRVLASAQLQGELFYRIFPEKVDTGNNPETLDWIIGRTRDGLDASTPRYVISLIKHGIDSVIKSLEMGEDPPGDGLLFTRASLKAALTRTSEEKVEQYLFAEFPRLREYFERLRHGKSRYGLDALAQLWGTDSPEAKRIAEKLKETGFWVQESSGEYWIPFIFRDGLGITQGAAE